MTHQLNVTHQSAHTIIHNRTFNGKPLYYFEDGLVLEYLEKIDRVLTEALNQYPRIYAVHINLNLPSDFGEDYLAVFAHFFRILESETNELCRDKYTDRTYQYQQTVIRYIWAKASESTSQHHHLILLFDRDLFQNFGTGREGWGRFLYKKVRKTWDKVVEANYSQPCTGLAYSPSNEGFELFSDTESFPLQLNEFFYRISRLAKPITNLNEHRNKSFGCSHDSPKKYSASNAYVINTQKVLLMANRTYLPSITLDRTFEDYPLYYSDKGLYESALTSMVDVFEQALSQFDIALATRLDLYLPKDHQDTDLSTLKDYFEILKEKLNTDSLHYVWRKRADSRSHHYQVMLFTDYKQHFGDVISMDKRNEIVGHLKTAWGETMKKHYKGNERSMAQLNDRGNYSLGTRCKSTDTDIKNCVYKRMSSLAEAWQEKRYFFGSSLE